MKDELKRDLERCLNEYPFLSGPQRTEIERILRINREAEKLWRFIDEHGGNERAWAVYFDKIKEANESAERFKARCGWFETVAYRAV